MKTRHYLIFNFLGYGIVALFLLGLIIVLKSDLFGLIFGILFILIFSYKSYSSYRQLKNVPSDEKMYTPPINASVQDQINSYKRVMIAGSIAIVALSIWVFIQLNELESGKVDSVKLWGPIPLLYDLGGYWLAVLSTPAVGVFVLVAGIRKIIILKNNSL